jgi:sodium/hydrogen antiporter
MVNRAVPAKIQRLINVESALNDGIATPLVLVAIAGAATAEHAASTGSGRAVAELALARQAHRPQPQSPQRPAST